MTPLPKDWVCPHFFLTQRFRLNSIFNSFRTNCFFVNLCTKEGGLSLGDGKMTFPDFYPGECSADGRLCSFLSREGTKLFREHQGDDSVHEEQIEEGEAYFRGEFLNRDLYDLQISTKSSGPRKSDVLEFIYDCK